MNHKKIRGITTCPSFIMRWRGRIDAKRKAVSYHEGRWQGPHIEKLCAACRAFICGVYDELENQMAATHKESAQLVIEHTQVKEMLSKPAPAATGKSPSARARSESAINTNRSALINRHYAIILRLAEIDETLIKALGNAVAVQGWAVEKTVEKIQVYLQGAAIICHETDNNSVETNLDPLCDKAYIDRHAGNDHMRRIILRDEAGLDDMEEKK